MLIISIVTAATKNDNLHDGSIAGLLMHQVLYLGDKINSPLRNFSLTWHGIISCFCHKIISMDQTT